MFAQRNKKGHKKDLYERALALVDGDCPESIAFKIHELARLRFFSI